MKSLFQFRNIDIFERDLLSTEFIPEMMREKVFEVDNQIIALFNISRFNYRFGKSIVVHQTKGVFFDHRTTKEIMNDFKRVNGIGFTFSKIIADFLELKHHLPYVHAYASYMPMTGGSRKCTDWVGLHWIQSYHQDKKEAHMITVNGDKLIFNFPHGDLEQRIHNVCVASEKSIAMISSVAKAGLAEIKPPPITGLVRKFENCQCKLHKKLARKLYDAGFTFDLVTKFLLNKIGIESAYPQTVMLFYRQNLDRLKKLY
ncbi:hypothetical protein [Companilactobacillus halodurans]|uniref:Uncharacterized protein n=1 Tax=Companilactobacillus halodurans TaxID=2584183 RepID=A0A5P0ZUV9_9LACO|nr:hypothetical protein [Companilactobacillus halodurans]MQS76922.1 hypothetical protein [Companilactobacillus halodurans]MQS96618.1 hypothetical protein [Companilactobacillus halodurans]